MISANIIESLKVFYDRLRNKKNWVLIGSISLAVQGVNVTPGDIDILTDKNGVYQINKLLKDYEVKPVKYRRSDMQRSHLGEFRVNDVKVELMADYREKVNGKWQSFASRLTSPAIVQFEGMSLPVSSLTVQLHSYEMSSREKDAVKVAEIKIILKSRHET